MNDEILQLQRQVGRLGWMAAAISPIWLGAECVAGLGLADSPLWSHYETNGFLNSIALALAGLFYYFYWAEPDRPALARVIAIGLLLALISLCLLPKLTITNHLFIGFGPAFAGETLHRLMCDPKKKKLHLVGTLLAIGLILMVGPLTPFFLQLTISLCPNTQDHLLLAADGSLGFQPSFLVGQLYEAAPLLSVVGAAFYDTLLLPFFLLVAVQLRRESTHTDVIIPFTVMGLLGFAIYLTFPVIGPGFAFPNFPLSTEAMTIRDVPRNCMPSLHTATALLCWWHSRSVTRGLRVICGAYLGIILVSILGIGLHYFVDIVVALPFAAAIQAGCLMAPRALAVRRWTTCWLNALLTLGWLLLLRYGVSTLLLSPVISSAAFLLTIGFAYVSEYRLDCAFRSGLCDAFNNTNPQTSENPCVGRQPSAAF